ncbi:MAG: carbohydrate ABC transporter permease [Gemmatimonadetes bacterium]|uniref:Carbohydrate ABC transporter permease n=1 Tax=Candidatus Kutchimonas denitrificans TaxID=3056748 RepID=A0AAE5CBT8_9BACT|nr:carbohydrate ABC transporter permease [Gemmatimonadota bacterium]NIR74835.1 carbohydrate ABC transporter permease [Candidatus Kutchimonas denitrificans]NIR99946.1 carbohydrate ABC transporter permease [Gemmatimonadota bacterium]NIT65530.1 carbohydrate ABC transporter permease [Gemmatimonadota bacterium]NIU52500.1 ABC transporter permease subunit [Gemmatimonadota bacterium]
MSDAAAASVARRRAVNAATYGAAVLLGISMLVPFLWMISTSLMDEFEVFQFPPRLIPADPVWSNYPNALTAAPFGRFFLNSAVMSLFIVAGHLFTAATAGYAFARLRFPGRDRVFILFLANLMVPVIVLLIPRFLLVGALGWVDTYMGLIVTELVSVWGIFLMRQYFLSIPRDLEDAARIDGASEWQIFWKVALPLARPALATVALFSFVETWKSFLWPLIVTRSMAMRPVEVGIAAFHGLYFSNWPYQMAAAVVAVVPILLLFLFTQRYFVRGIQLAGLKG